MTLSVPDRSHKERWDEAQKRMWNSDPNRILSLLYHPYHPNNPSNPYARKPRLEKSDKQEREVHTCDDPSETTAE